jgi:hemolysin III
MPSRDALKVVDQGCAAFERPQSLGEEIANSLSHGLGLLAALATIPLLIVHAARRGGAGFIVGASIFSVAMAWLYLTSTLYHALPRGRAKQVFRLIEHTAIFFLIAGTYTPFTLGVLRGGWGWTLFGLIWGLATAGILLKMIGGVRFPLVSTLLYLGMGWLILIAIHPLWLRMPLAGFFWIALGGLSYTAGVAFYALDHRLRYSHFVWHLFVIAGTVFHYLAVYWYAA